MHALSHIGQPTTTELAAATISLDNKNVAQFLANALVVEAIKRNQRQHNDLEKLLAMIANNELKFQAELDCTEPLRPIATISIVLDDTIPRTMEDKLIVRLVAGFMGVIDNMPPEPQL